MIYRAVFKFDERNHLGVKATGSEFADFKSNFGNDERGFGYIRIKVMINNIYSLENLFLEMLQNMQQFGRQFYQA